MSDADIQEILARNLGSSTQKPAVEKADEEPRGKYSDIIREAMAKQIEKPEAPKKAEKKPTLWESIKKKFLREEKKPAAAVAPAEQKDADELDPNQFKDPERRELAIASNEARKVAKERKLGVFAGQPGAPTAGPTGRRVDEPDALEGLVDAYERSEAQKKPVDSKQPDQITSQAGERLNIPASEFDPYAELTNAKAKPVEGPLGRALQAVKGPEISTLQTQKPTGITKMLSPEFWGGPEDIAKSKNIVALQGMLTDQKNVAEGAELEKKHESLSKSVREVGDLKQKIEDRSADVEKARKLKESLDALKVDKSDADSVKQYNGLVNKYNAQVKTLKGFNELVTTHNKKLESLKADMDAFNKQAEKYSPKGIPPLSEIAKNYDAITKELDIRGDMTNKEFADKLMTAAIALSFYAAPVKLMLGLGSYMAGKEYESVVTQMTRGEKPKFRQGAELKDLVQATYPATGAEP